MDVWMGLWRLSDMHIDVLIQWVIEQTYIDELDWKANILKNVLKTVWSIKPVSKNLNDKMDFTNYVDIVLMEEDCPNEVKYINGVVLNCNIADWWMKKDFSNPWILLL